MKLAVASGKGGTGKTTISLALAEYLAGKGRTVSICDCDVEEPNINLFLKADISNVEKFNMLIPLVDEEKCNGCGKCQDICEFSAIVLVNDKPLVFPDMCHSCGGCMLACPEGAITEIKKNIGILETGEKKNLKYIGGKLNVGEPMAPPLIKAVKKDIERSENIIIDSPPGTSCPVIESVKDSDYVLLVTEPTPFGLNDLKIAVEMVRAIGIPFGVLINRSDVGDDGVVDFCKKENVNIIGKIPNSRQLAEKYSQGDFMIYFVDKFDKEIEKVISEIKDSI